MAFHAVGIRLGAGFLKGGEGVGVAGFAPCFVIFRMALLAGLGADVGGGGRYAGNGVGIGLLAASMARGVLEISFR